MHTFTEEEPDNNSITHKKIHTYDNMNITDTDISIILIIAKYFKIDVIIRSCHIECKTTTSRQWNKLLKIAKITDSKIYLATGQKIAAKTRKMLEPNEVIESNYIDYLLLANGNSLVNLPEKEIAKLNLSNKDLRKVSLPINADLFQLIPYKKVSNIKLPDVDFNNYDINGVSFIDCKFSKNTVFPPNFFQEIKNKALIGCSLPAINFETDYIKNCTFLFVNFDKKTIFPKDKFFFKNFDLLDCCKLPICNYTIYDFSDVNIRHCVFPEKSKLPYSQYLADTIIENRYPKSYISSIHIMPLKNVCFDEIMLKYGNKLSEIQKTVIYYKLVGID